MTVDHPLRQWRETQNPRLSQESAGVLLGVDEMTVSRWERRETEPQKRQWDKIEDVTGLSRARFLGFLEAAAE